MPGLPARCRWCSSPDVDPIPPEVALPGGPASFLTRFPEALSDQSRLIFRSQPTPRQRFGGNALFEMFLHKAEEQAASGELSQTDFEKARGTYLQLTERLARAAPSALVRFAAMMQEGFRDEAVLKSLEAHTPGATEQLRPVIPYLAKSEHDKIFGPPEDLELTQDQMRADLLDFAAFVEELHKESDRGAALVGAALIDDRLAGR
jgi:hypothetical protein